MSLTLSALLRDEAGFVISAELVLIASVLVIGMIVGLSEIQHAIVTELNDVGDAVGSLNQSFVFSGMSSRKAGGGYKGMISGSSFNDTADDCDNNQCDISCDYPMAEGMKGGGNNPD